MTKPISQPKAPIPELDDVQVLVNMLTEYGSAGNNPPCDAASVIAWLRDATGYGDLIKVNAVTANHASDNEQPVETTSVIPTVREPHGFFHPEVVRRRAIREKRNRPDSAGPD